MKWRNFFSWSFFLVGLGILLFTITYPIATWYWSWIFRPLSIFDPEKVSPYPIPKFLNAKGLYQDLPMATVSAWFPSQSLATVSSSTISAFLISFPTLKITDIPVKTNGSDLKKSPIHYPGSALPGQIGNTVILGHSALPYLYLFKSPQAVFNPLLRMKIGDTIDIDFDGQSFRYQVNQIVEVSPDKIEVLAQPGNRRQISLITCVPLGTYLRRLVVVGDLIN